MTSDAHYMTAPDVSASGLAHSMEQALRISSAHGTGTRHQDANEVRIDGVNVASLSDSAAATLRNRMIGFIFQSFHLIPVLTAAENVAYPLVLRGMPPRQRRQRTRDLLSRVGLGEFVNQRPNRLSGGQRQRVAIARALACESLIVLANEPTANC